MQSLCTAVAPLRDVLKVAVEASLHTHNSLPGALSAQRKVGFMTQQRGTNYGVRG